MLLTMARDVLVLYAKRATLIMKPKACCRALKAIGDLLIWKMKDYVLY